MPPVGSSTPCRRSFRSVLMTDPRLTHALQLTLSLCIAGILSNLDGSIPHFSAPLPAPFSGVLICKAFMSLVGLTDHWFTWQITSSRTLNKVFTRQQKVSFVDEPEVRVFSAEWPKDPSLWIKLRGLDKEKRKGISLIRFTNQRQLFMLNLEDPP